MSEQLINKKMNIDNGERNVIFDNGITKSEYNELKALLEKNNFYLKFLYQFTQKIDKIIFWSKIWTVAKLIFIIAPIIIAYVYVLPLIDSFLNQYRGFYEKMFNL